MWISGTGADVLHCQHCHPSVAWIVYKPGEAPQFAYAGFPTNGQVVLAKKKVLVVCARCSGGLEAMRAEVKEAFAPSVESTSLHSDPLQTPES
jgi:hypothetical protein